MYPQLRVHQRPVLYVTPCLIFLNQRRMLRSFWRAAVLTEPVTAPMMAVSSVVISTVQDCRPYHRHTLVAWQIEHVAGRNHEP
jgi:hypothetical protein